jgi:hypothetical protein
MTPVVLAAVLVPAFCAATWRHGMTLAILAASVLMWLLPIEPRWWSRSDGEETSPARRSAADIALLSGCWLLATWALWQHRVLPLVVCAVAGVLVMIDVASRPAAPPPVCVPERTPRRRVLRTDPDLSA